MCEAIYAWLLRLYPEAFRKEYGDEALLLFRDRFGDEKGFFRRLRFWFDITADLMISVFHEHRRLEQAALAAAGNSYVAGAPRFYVFEDEGPRRPTLLAGFVLSVVVFNLVHVAMLNGGGPRPQRPGPLLGGAIFQATGEGRPTFEVASVKPNLSPGPGMFPGWFQPATRFTATRATLKSLIRLAYSIQMDDWRIEGGPRWIEADAFDVEGRPPGPVGADQMMLMLRSLLEDRFKLKVHREMREMPVYFLVIGKGGHKLEQLKDKDGRPILEIGPPKPGDAPPPPPPPPPAPPGAGVDTVLRRLHASGWSMTQLASALWRPMGRPVIDKTGLSGLFIFNLDWTPDSGVTGADAPLPISTGPSIFTAVQEQLGLRLESGRAQVEYIVVDGAEKPAEN